VIDYFYSLPDESGQSSCVHCPEGTECAENGVSTQHNLFVAEKWWRISDTATTVRPCPLEEACKGGRLESDNRRLGDSIDWSDGYCNDGKNMHYLRYIVTHHSFFV
jgi:hypothetical protein